MSFHRVVNLSPFLDGRIVEISDEFELHQGEGGYPVLCIYDPNIVVGDRIGQYPCAEGALFIKGDNLIRTEDPRREFDDSNVYGEFLFEGSYRKDSLEVVYSKFENVLSVSVIEHVDEDYSKTLYAQNFFTKANEVLGRIEDMLRGDSDPEDFVFVLESLKSEEKN